MIVHLSSKGPQYLPLVKAHAMLGHRASQKRLFPYSVVEAQIQNNFWPQLQGTNKNHAPTQRMVLIWEKDRFDYPEWALGVGLVSENDLLPWAREQLIKPQHLAQPMWQTYSWSGQQSAHVGGSPSSGLSRTLLFLGFATLVVLAIKQMASPPVRALPPVSGLVGSGFQRRPWGGYR